MQDCKGLDQQQSGGDISGALSEFSKKCRSIYDELENFIKNKLIEFEKDELGISPHDFLKNPIIIDNEPCRYKYRCEIEKFPLKKVSLNFWDAEAYTGQKNRKLTKNSNGCPNYFLDASTVKKIKKIKKYIGLANTRLQLYSSVLDASFSN